MTLALIPAAGHASGLDAPAVGSLLSGPLTTDPAAVHHNPGQLGFLQRPTLLVGVGLVVGSVGFERERKGAYQSEETFDFKTPLPPEDLDAEKTGNGGEASATPLSPAGDLFFSAGLGHSGVTLALGAYAPYAAIVDYGDGGPQRFALQSANIAIPHFTGALGVKANKYFGLGVGVSYVLGVAELSRIQDFGALDDFGDALARPPVAQPNDFGVDAPTEVRELDVLARPVDVTDAVAHAVTFNLGVSVRPTDALDLAVTYQHGADLSFDGKFALDLNDDYFTGDLEHVGLKFKSFISGDATVRFALPKRFGAAAGYDVTEALRLELRAQYVTWSDVDSFDIRLESPDLAQPRLGLPPSSEVSLPRRWNDTVTLFATTRVLLKPGLYLLGLLGYDSPASPDETMDAASPDGHRLTVGLGTGVALTKDTSILADARVGTLIPRTITNSENDLGNGRYTLVLAAIMAHLQVKF